MDFNSGKPGEKSFRERLLNLCGYEIWPRTHNDPTIMGPQPRIISKRQADAIRAMAESDGDESVVCCQSEHMRDA